MLFITIHCIVDIVGIIGMVDEHVFIIVIEDVTDINTGTSGKATVTTVTTILVVPTVVTTTGIAHGDRAVSDNNIGDDVISDDSKSGIAADIHITHIKSTCTVHIIGVNIRHVIATIDAAGTSTIRPGSVYCCGR